jgi:single-strand DNA-binding protein
MANFNKVFLMGNLTRDPELRYLPNGTAVTSFTLASNRVYTLQTGEKKEEATFMRVVVWGKRAETCGEYLNKGSAAFVEGRLQNRSWVGQDGQKRNTVEIVAENVQFIGRPRNQNQDSSVDVNRSQGGSDFVPDFDLPTDKSQSEPTDEQIPF